MAATNEVVKTTETRVRVFVRNGPVVEGFAHVHHGSYRGRLSDVLNLGEMRYLPITDATYREQHSDEPVSTETVLISVEDIVMIDATVTGDAGTAGAAAGDAAEDAGGGSLSGASL